jgi:23S rRNA (guanosine2251-2'-O)-methyltransferase
MNNRMRKSGKPPGSRSAKPSGSPRSGRDEPRRGRHSGNKDKRAEEKRSDKPTRGEFKGKSGFRDKAEHKDASRSTPRGERTGQFRAPQEKREFRPRDSETRETRPLQNRAPREARVKEPRVAREPRASLGPKANMFGLHAVREAWLNPKRSIHAIYLTPQTEEQFAPVLEQADRKGLGRPEPKIISKDDFERLLGRDTVHQGAALSAAPLEEAFIQDIISVGAGKERSVILMLDQVTDPHNVGAILRSACAFGADGVVMQRRHAPELDGIVAKTASGAAEHILVAYETNLSRTLEDLSEAGYIIIGLDEHADKSLTDVTVPDKCVLILGAEGDGMRRLIKEHCDVLITLPTRAPIASLNVSNAAAVALYALIR